MTLRQRDRQIVRPRRLLFEQVEDRRLLTAFNITKLADESTINPSNGVPFEFLSDAHVEGDVVTFYGFGPGSRDGIYSLINGEIAPIVDGTTLVPPDNSATYRTLSEHWLDDNVAFRGRITNLHQGIYTSELDGSVRKVADRTSLVPGQTTVFQDFQDSPVTNGNDVVFGATGVFWPQTGLYGGSGIFIAAQDGTIRTVADVTTVVPGGGGTFHDFRGVGHLGISGKTVSFWAFSGETGIYQRDMSTDPPGPVQTIVDSQSTNPNTGQAVGYIGVDHAYSGNTVAFIGGLGDGRAVYLHDGANLLPIASVGSTTADGLIEFGSFDTDNVIGNDNGNIVFVAADTANIDGIYTNIGGELEAVYREDQPLDGRFPVTLRVSDQAIDGNTIVFQARFADGSTSIYRAEADLPEPPTAQLGLDRWWATVGQGALDVEWTLDVPADGNYEINIDFGVFSDWDLRGGATVLVNGVEVDSFGPTGRADLQFLVAGRHTLTVSSLAVPNEPAVELVTFNLIDSSTNTPVEILKSLFVADVPGVLNTDTYTVAVDGNNRVFTVEEIVDEFAPILHFSSDERYTVPFDVEEAILATARPNGLYHGGVRRGDAEDVLDTSSFLHGLPEGPIPANIPAGFYNSDTTPGAVYATVTSTDNHFAINYWFFYGASNWAQHGGKNTHELDVEGISIGFHNQGGTLTPTQVVYAQHDVVAAPVVNPSQVVAWDYIERTNDDTRPHVYVGLGGHASYPFVGLTEVLTVPELSHLQLHQKEAHDGQQGHPFAAEPNQVHLLPRITDPNAPEWLRYAGFLGNPDLDDDPSTIDDGAPRGPVFLHRLGLRTVFGERYLDPFGSWVEPFASFVPGNITVVAKKNKVTISGSVDADHFEVRQVNNDWVVTGLHGTTVNGSPGPIAIPNAPGRLKIDGLGGGNDAVLLRDLVLTQMLHIKTGSGDDFVRASGVTSLNETVLNMGKGADLIDLTSSLLGSTTGIAMGNGADEIISRDLLFEAGGIVDFGEGFDILRTDDPLLGILLLEFEAIVSI